jgi:hypothetical protein
MAPLVVVGSSPKPVDGSEAFRADPLGGALQISLNFTPAGAKAGRTEIPAAPKDGKQGSP